MQSTFFIGSFLAKIFAGHFYLEIADISARGCKDPGFCDPEFGKSWSSIPPKEAIEASGLLLRAPRVPGGRSLHFRITFGTMLPLGAALELRINPFSEPNIANNLRLCTAVDM